MNRGTTLLSNQLVLQFAAFASIVGTLYTIQHFASYQNTWLYTIALLSFLKIIGVVGERNGGGFKYFAVGALSESGLFSVIQFFSASYLGFFGFPAGYITAHYIVSIINSISNGRFKFEEPSVLDVIVCAVILPLAIIYPFINIPLWQLPKDTESLFINFLEDPRKFCLLFIVFSSIQGLAETFFKKE